MPDIIIEFLGHKYPIYCPSNEKEICKNYRQRFIACGEQFKAKLEGVLEENIAKTPANATELKNKYQEIVKLIDTKISEKINEFAKKCTEEKSV